MGRAGGQTQISGRNTLRNRAGDRDQEHFGRDGVELDEIFSDRRRHRGPEQKWTGKSSTGSESKS